jgi:hypothetical protein
MQRKATMDATSSGSPILPMGTRAISLFASSGSIVFCSSIQHKPFTQCMHDVTYNHVEINTSSSALFRRKIDIWLARLGRRALTHIAADVGSDAPRRDAVDADAVAGPLGGEAARELVQGALGHGVDGERREPDEASDGGDVHDAAAPAAAGEAEERVRELAEVEARLQVGRHDPGVVLAGALGRPLEQGLPRVVHEDIEPAAEGGPHGGHEARAVGAPRHVAGGHGHLQPLLVPSPPALLQLRRVARARVHPGAEPGELLDDRVPAMPFVLLCHPTPLVIQMKHVLYVCMYVCTQCPCCRR